MTERGRTISLLGRVAIVPPGDGGAPITPRGRRTELVFAYLAAEHHRLVTHDELADALWPGQLPDTWAAALRGVLTELRRFLIDGGLDPSALTTARGGHQLALSTDVTVDVDIARDALAAGQTALAAGSAHAAAAHATRSSSLARLAFLPNHEADWVTGVRRELAAVCSRALDVQARAHALAGDLGEAASAAERLVELEPFSEAAHQLRIRILGEAGDRAAALRAFDHCRSVLADELGVEPSEETVAVLRAATEYGAALPAASAPPTPSAPPSAPAGLGGLDVLVVEDHDFQRRVAVMLLRSLGVGAVTEAGDGLAALELLDGASVPDVVLCDIDMPGMDGVDFIRHVAERELAGAVIIASALDAKVVQAVRAIGEGYGLQVLGALEKPLTARRLGELLAAYRPRPSAADAATGANSTVTAADAAQALDDGSIEFMLQPGIEVSTGEVACAHVVARWPVVDGTDIPPSVFVPLLARQGLSGDLAQRAFVDACASLQTLLETGLDLNVSVGLGPDGLHDTQMADRAATLALAAGADPARLTVELDERAFRSAAPHALGILTRLRVKGFGVSLAEFGTASTPADQLTGLPLTELKLSAALVTGASRDASLTRILEETVESGRRLGVPIVGDGCESEDDLRLLLSVGCDRLQGGHIAEAMRGEAFPGWVAIWDPGRLSVGGPA